jgi:hypothetical protein
VVDNGIQRAAVFSVKELRWECYVHIIAEQIDTTRRTMCHVDVNQENF